MGLDAFLREVEHRTHLKRALADAESPLDHPKTMILRYDLLSGQVRIRNITFQAIPKTVLCNLLLVDAYGYVPADLEKLVVAVPVDVFLGQSAFSISLAESLDSLVAVFFFALASE